MVRGDDPQCRHVLAEQRDLVGGEVPPVDAVAVGPLEQRVVDVGDVLHVVHVVPGVAQAPAEEVEGDVGRRVTMWVASYGVMPQTYIRATGPGVDGRTAAPAVSKTWTGRPVPGTAGMNGEGQAFTSGA